jgi:hypothetical protein
MHAVWWWGSEGRCLRWGSKKGARPLPWFASASLASAVDRDAPLGLTFSSPTIPSRGIPASGTDGTDHLRSPCFIRPMNNNIHLPMPHAQLLKSALICALCLLGYCVLYLSFGEQSYTQFGIRWDPAFYLETTQRFPELITSNAIPAYGFQRILPAGIVYAAMSALTIPLSQENIVLAYDVYTVIVVMLSLFVWYLINRKAQLSKTTFWIGTAALFCTSAVLKIYLYMPLNTDSMAFLLGLLLVYAWVNNSRLWMAVVIALSAFTWPSAIFSGLLLLLGHKVSLDTLKRPAGPSAENNRPALVLSGLAVAGIIGLIVAFMALGIQMPRGSSPTVMPLLPISMLLLGAYVFHVCHTILKPLDLTAKSISNTLKNIGIAHLAVCLALFLANRLLIELYASAQTGGFGLPSFIRNVSMSSITMPLKFLVAHVTYFGPIVLLFVLFWKQFSEKLLTSDLGVLCFIGIHLAQSIAAESRQLIWAYPFLVFLLLTSIDKLSFKPSIVPVFLLTSLVFSRFWFPINRVPFPGLDDDPIAHFQSFPWQGFVMYHGPWISFDVYLVLLPIVIATGLFYHRFYAKPAKAQAARPGLNASAP